MQKLENLIGELGLSQRPLIYITLGKASMEESKFEDVIYFFKKAKEIYEKNKNWGLTGKVCESIGKFYHQLDKLGEGIKYEEMAAEFFQRDEIGY